ncbi:MAG: hypothetical protein HYZ54_05935, partial [Ignavibacteriae bacterium]|nr:hypothetical protein [Ignavibacteriota bacterium]
YFLENFSFKATKIELCKHKHKHKRHSPKQPKGVRFKYWLGISQIVGGCILMPFNPAAGSALILSGTATTGDAVSDALNNKENWEKDLNDRQRIGPDKTFNRQSSFKTCPFTLRI